MYTNTMSWAPSLKIRKVMRTFLTLVVALMVTIATTQVAEAKRFGGGRSFGKSFRTAPAPKWKSRNTDSISKKQTGKSQNSSRKGLLGGLLGGLLVGGLFASLFGGGLGSALGGILNILIIGLVAAFILKFARRLLMAKNGSMNHSNQQTTYASGNPYSNHQQGIQLKEINPNSRTSNEHYDDVPFNFLPEFDRGTFINGAREHYQILQDAWNLNQLETISEYVTPELFEQLKLERASLNGEQHTEVMYVNAEIVRADYDNDKSQISVQFGGRYRDKTEGIEEEIQDLWHLERDLTIPNEPWLIVGMQ